MFKEISRNELREFFQPSRVILVVVYDYKHKRYNFLPIAFNMYSGYKPLSMCFAVHDINYSHQLLKKEREFVIAIPGELLANVVLSAGMESGSNVDKFQKYFLTPYSIDESQCVGIKECKANIFCEKTCFIPVGDHALVVGNVKRIFMDKNGKHKEANHFVSEYF